MDQAKEKLAALRALWDEKCSDGRLPARSDFAVQVLRPWLGNLALLDLDSDGDAAFRLCGTKLFQRFGGEMTRRKLAALENRIADQLKKCVTEVRLSRQPSELQADLNIDGTTTSYFEMVLPLAEDGSSVDTLLFVSYPAKET